MFAVLRRNFIFACVMLSIINLAATLRADNSVQVAQGSGELTAPGYYNQDYTVSSIDTTRFPNGGTLVINISLGSGISSGSFDVFPQGAPIPTYGQPTGTLGGAYDISPGSTAQITVQFTQGQVFQFGATGNWFSQVGTTNTYSFTAFVTPNAPPPPDVAISTPYSGAFPESRYVALTGTGPANTIVAVVVDGDTDPNKIATTDADGNWEKVVYTGSGHHTLAVENYTNPIDVSDPISIIADPAPTLPRTTTDYTLLQKADIFLTKGYKSPQIEIYGIPTTTGLNYTHTALYLGGNNSGTPMIAEAVPDKEGGVRAVPLEMSSVYTDGTLVDIYRPKAALTKGQKSAIVNWTENYTNKGLHYWSYPFLSGFGAFVSSAVVYDQKDDKPTFYFPNTLTRMDINKYATDRFICSTLVWHSYLSGTGGQVDLSLNNHADFGGFLKSYVYTDKWLHLVQPHFVFPDTLAEGGQLYKVN